jgi:hypothetical protein
VIFALVSCGSSTRAPIANRGGDREAPPVLVAPILDERGFRGHPDGAMPTKQEIESWLPGAIAHISEGGIVVDLPGVPQSKLVYNSIPEGIALLVTDEGRIVDVFAREVTMSHGLEVGMTLDDAKRRHPELTCTTGMGTTTCSLPRSRFAFHIFEGLAQAARIDYVTWVRE